MLPDLSYEQKNLHIRYELLSKEFSELFTEKNELLTYEKDYLTALYLNTVGQRMHRKYCLQIEIKMLFQRIQLAQGYINQNKYPDKALIEKQINDKFAGFQQKIASEAKQLEEAKKFFTQNTFVPPHIALKIKEVYKAIVKKLHPDIHPDASEYEKDLLLQVQAAYDMSNLDMLNAILLKLDINNTVAVISLPGIQQLVEKMEAQVLHLKQQIEQLQLTFPFNYREKLSDEKWISAEQQSLDKDIDELNAEKKKYTEYLELINEWKPQLLS